jgi:hypothetical protein
MRHSSGFGINFLFHKIFFWVWHWNFLLIFFYKKLEICKLFKGSNINFMIWFWFPSQKVFLATSLCRLIILKAFSIHSIILQIIKEHPLESINESALMQLLSWHLLCKALIIKMKACTGEIKWNEVATIRKCMS